MSSEPPKNPAQTTPVEPFKRGRIQWGRPPQAMFQVGSLPPVAGGMSSLVRPAGQSKTGLFTGSMVPPAKAAEPEVVAPVVEPVTVEVVEQPVIQPEPELAPAPPEIVVEVEAAEPVDTVPPPLSSEPAVEAKPRSVPSVVVTPAIYATVSAAIETVTKKDRWMIVAAVVAVVVTGGFIWLATLPSGGDAALDLNAPPPAAAGLEAVEAEPVADPVPETVEPETAPARAETPAAPAPTQTPAPARTAPRVQAPSVVVPPPVEPRPYIQTAPLIEAAPTPAAPPPSDPDAPIATQPQPLD